MQLRLDDEDEVSHRVLDIVSIDVA